MVLDAVLADPDRNWLATEQDKVSYFTLRYRIPRQDLPSLTFRAEDAETVRYFPEKLPIGRDGDGRTHVFLYLLTQDLPIDFRAFLERHAELLRALPAWTVRLLVPRHKIDAILATTRRSTSSSPRPFVRALWKICAGTSARAAARRRVRTSGLIRPRVRSVRHGFRRCIEPGWSAANLYWTRRCRRR